MSKSTDDPSGTRTVTSETPRYATDNNTRVKRRHDRGFYDHETVHAALDGAMLCHIAYVVDAQPYCTPTFFWREGSRLFWHGSKMSRMLRKQSASLPVCVTVTHLDALILARSGFNHSADYRSVMAFGHARLIEDEAEKHRALVMMVDRLFPRRTETLRQATDGDITETTVIGMDIERAAAKIRAGGVADDEEDYALPVYAESLPVHTVLGEPEPCPRLPPSVTRPDHLAGYQKGRSLEDALAESHKRAFDPDS